jgi:hypothetical protein
LLELKRGGLVGSRRGRDGGHFLLKDPEKITLGQVLRLIDGPVAPLPCLSRTAYSRCADCADEAACGCGACSDKPMRRPSRSWSGFRSPMPGPPPRPSATVPRTSLRPMPRLIGAVGGGGVELRG